VPSANDPHGSHGFCLLNNVAIGAAYAMNTYQHKGIQRVAILDFDVHHGNGTQACVLNCLPHTEQFSYSDPYSSGVHRYSVYKPWRDQDDEECIFFASVQGYGKKHQRIDAYVYPGSGGTFDTHAAEEAAAAEAEAEEGTGMGTDPAAAGTDAAAGAEGAAAGAGAGAPAAASVVEEVEVEEDPDHEFSNTECEHPAPGSGPRVINVGIPGPGAHPAYWRRAWRDKVLPALVNFRPDMIFVSAGFDAHRKDGINYRYVGVREEEYEWLTDQLVQVGGSGCIGGGGAVCV
jgi:acetoin utilization deacetylase AcuC-like enzyme